MSLLTAPFEISRSDYLRNSTLIQPISTDWPVFSPGPFLDFTKNGAAPTQRVGQPFGHCQVPLGGPNLVQFGEGCGNRGPGNAGLCNSDLYRAVSQSAVGYLLAGSASLTCLCVGGRRCYLRESKHDKLTLLVVSLT